MDTKLFQLSRDVKFTSAAFKAKESLFPTYLKDQMVVVDDFRVTYKALKKQIEVVTLDRRTSKRNIETITAKAIDLLNELSFRVKKDRPEAYKEYFPVNYSTTITTKNKLIKGYEIVRSELNMETIPSLIDFKDQIETIYQTLQEETDRVTDAKTDHKYLQEEIDQLYKNWSLEYKRLKMMVKAVLLGEETSYKIFFETKSVKRSKTDFNQPFLPSSIIAKDAQTSHQAADI